MITQRIFPTTVETISFLYREGKTLEQLGYFFGVSRERIRQLLEGHVSANEGGAKIRLVSNEEKTRQRLEAAKRKQEQKIEKIFGCSYLQITEINGFPWNYSKRLTRCKATIFYEQFQNAKRRCIEWRLSFPAWWNVWEDSGHWRHRGRHKESWCMSRKGDLGAYEIGNVVIQPHVKNSSEGQRRWRDELGLTPRERMVHDLVSQGIQSPSEISKRLNIRPGVVTSMKINIKRRLEIGVPA